MPAKKPWNVCAIAPGRIPPSDGAENIYLNGALLGMAMRDIHRRFEQIVEFAGIGECLDAPVKTYSSGMHEVRLRHCHPFHPALQADR
jgi:lipopolysaccharide transport system ATP-binding protein